ncbi:hypothetical protein BDZ94DRAFT_63803 [Collybia nuda]|uniref:Uncharacterized protein n=1 Tax=Collybia nuda TaxID=64659 RepID=A0A9P6CAW7_9AGAR|nr:hypothetical protein BDZ94DRAFT_63803 [Collybia nuda]
MFSLRRCSHVHLARRIGFSSIRSSSRNFALQAQCAARHTNSRSEPWLASSRIHIRATLNTKGISTSRRTNSTYARPTTSTTATPDLDEHGLELPMSQSEHSQILARAAHVWPAPAPPSQLPPGWSSTWSQWPYLLTYFWLSPYFLMLPQIEMLLNVRHGVPGEARPVVFCVGRNAFVCTIVPGEWAGEKGGGFYLVEGGAGAGAGGEAGGEAEAEAENGEGGGEGGGLWHFSDVRNEKELLELLHADPSLSSAKQPGGGLVQVPISPEGGDALARVLARDESVIPILAEKFLDYVPEKTGVEEESVMLGEGGEEIVREVAERMKDGMGEEEGLRMMEGLVKEIETKLAEEEKGGGR